MTRLLLLVLSMSSLAAPAEIPVPTYRRLPTWAATMTGASQCFGDFKRQLRETDVRLGLDQVQLLEWRRLEAPGGNFLAAPAGQPAMSTVFPPETLTQLGEFEWDGARRHVFADISRRGIAPDRIEIASRPDKDREHAGFLFRYLIAQGNRQLDFWHAAPVSSQVFLNGAPASAVLPPALERHKTVLHLKKGRNLLTIKLAPLPARATFDPAFRPGIGEWDEREVVKEIRAGLLRDFPAATASFVNINGHDFAAWLAAPDLAGFTAKLEARLSGEESVPYVSCLRDLANGSVLERFEQLVASVVALNGRDVPPVAFVKRRGYGMNGTNATMFAHRTGRGSAVCVADPNKPAEAHRVLLETKDGFVWDLSPSYDGRRLLMSYKEQNDQPFSVWETSVDGSGLRRLTDGKFHDFNPVYYPDGRIVFCSSRVQSYSLCQNFLACALHIMNGDGSNLRRIDFTTLCSNAPAVLPDGSIVCTRWEYQDKNIFSWQGLWSIHPDGRQLQLFFGNTITVPNSRYGAKPVPGTGNVIITTAGHHKPPVADIALVDRSRGVENPAALTQITHATPCEVRQGENWRDTNWGPGDVLVPEAYADPMPLDERRILVAFAGDESLPHRIWLLDLHGIGGPMIEDATSSCFAPVPLGPRERPLPIAGEAPQQPGEGTFYVQDIYRGLREQGVTPGLVKELRVVRVLPKKWNTEGQRFNDHYPIVGHGSYYVKENLGTAPVREDGSVWFRAPSNCELYFIALDQDGKEVQRMGSVTQVTTGHEAGCVGCHEPRGSAPPASANERKRQRGPDPLQAPPWGAGPFDYVAHVQPALDRYCVKCHEGRTPGANLDLSGDKTRFFNMSYEALIHGRWVEFYFINPGPTGVFPALQSGSQVSRLTQLIESGHGGRVTMDHESRRRIYAWIDSNVQYYATWDMSRPHTVGGRDAWMFCAGDKRVTPKPEPWMARLEQAFAKAGCAACHSPLIDEAGRAHSDYNAKINLTRPEFSRLVNAHLSKSAGGLGIAGKRNGEEAPVFTSTDDARYRMLLEPICAGREALLSRPRMDMPGGKAVPQERDFAKVF